MKDAVKTIIGKRIKGIVTKERPDSPRYQLFLIFSDDTYFEFYSTHGNIHCAGGIDKGGIDAARNYLGEQFITLESCDESIADRPMGTGNEQDGDALAELILEDPEEAIRMLVAKIDDLRGAMTRRDQELQVRFDAFEREQSARDAANLKKCAVELILEDPEEAIRMLVAKIDDLRGAMTRRDQELQVRLDAFERERSAREAANPKKDAAELILEDPEEAIRTLVASIDDLRGAMTRRDQELQVRIDAFERERSAREAANLKKGAAELILEDPEEAMRTLVTTIKDLRGEMTRRDQELQVRLDAFERERQEDIPMSVENDKEKYDGELLFATDSKRKHKTDRDSARESGISLGDDLIGKPDGTYQYYDNQGKMHEGWMPPENIENVLKEPGVKKPSKVLIKGPWEGVREQLWNINNETIEKFADNDGTIYVWCVLEKGEPTYMYMSKGAWVNAEKIVEISRNPSLSEKEKNDQIGKLCRD